LREDWRKGGRAHRPSAISQGALSGLRGLTPQKFLNPREGKTIRLANSNAVNAFGMAEASLVNGFLKSSTKRQHQERDLEPEQAADLSEDGMLSPTNSMQRWISRCAPVRTSNRHRMRPQGRTMPGWPSTFGMNGLWGGIESPVAESSRAIVGARLTSSCDDQTDHKRYGQ
jgi:hypothetical protein